MGQMPKKVQRGLGRCWCDGVDSGGAARDTILTVALQPWLLPCPATQGMHVDATRKEPLRAPVQLLAASQLPAANRRKEGERKRCLPLPFCHFKMAWRGFVVPVAAPWQLRGQPWQLVAPSPGGSQLSGATPPWWQCLPPHRVQVPGCPLPPELSEAEHSQAGGQPLPRHP